MSETVSHHIKFILFSKYTTDQPAHPSRLQPHLLAPDKMPAESLEPSGNPVYSVWSYSGHKQQSVHDNGIHMYSVAVPDLSSLTHCT